jgi:hypothetical protein
MLCKYENAYGDKCSFNLINHKNGFVPLQKIEWWSKGCDYRVELEAWECVLLISQWREVNDELRHLKEENIKLTKEVSGLKTKH